MVKYNKEGDIVFSSSTDSKITAWFSDSGERLGTYEGHGGKVWGFDVTRDCSLLISCSADSTLKVWNVETGECRYTFQNKAPVHSVAFSEDEKFFAAAIDPFQGDPPCILIYKFDKTLEFQDSSPVRRILGHQAAINKVMWGPMDMTLVTCSDDCTVRSWDPETGDELFCIQDNEKEVLSIAFNEDKTLLLSGSKDCTARLYDFLKDMKHLKTYKTTRPINAVGISPLMDQVAVGGGLAARDVTTTAGELGKFETHFFHAVFEDHLGSVKGHFGPINTLAFSPDGKSFTTGGEEGYVRIHHMDEEFFKSDKELGFV
eukprot:CAMPEP_0113875838 /NCGR_PEP_ID=MMETSP0780_2-20120614/5157_1 /TAXON_ID=652834 /ORGANISM="Palpitomonas bilix" /LENGTH=315 /DNA_ID=CAMNT_0000861857 /DNA_START=74 /DNA_END=1021 /DNA_ORIENTATION=+ /assembly_acc=CAM_ASM_000599